MDYKALLKKYMLHVIEQEGIDFLRHNYCALDDPFSYDEHKELMLISTELAEEI